MDDGAVVVRAGEWKTAGAGDRLVTIGLGSCVAIVLHDAVANVGGMAHTLLPHPLEGRPLEPAGRFVTVAVPQLLVAVVRAGADRDRVYARLVGGATMFPQLIGAGEVRSVGERNIQAARAALRDAGIPVRGEALGGTAGRSVYFDVAKGEVVVKSLREPEVVL